MTGHYFFVFKDKVVMKQDVKKVWSVCLLVLNVMLVFGQPATPVLSGKVLSKDKE